MANFLKFSFTEHDTYINMDLVYRIAIDDNEMTLYFNSDNDFDNQFTYSINKLLNKTFIEDALKVFTKASATPTKFK